MQSKKRAYACFLFFVLTAFMLTELVLATIANLTVQNGEQVNCPIKLANDDRVIVQFSVIGQNKNTLHFSIAFPNGTVKDYGEIGDFHLSFISDFEGQCLLNFTNNDITEDKLVTLDYEIDHYIFGIPQMLFMTLLIGVICVGGVAVFIMLSRKPY